MPTFHSIRPSMFTALKVALCPAVLAGLAACTPSANAPTAGNTCPSVTSIHQTKEEQGYSYSAIAPGGGWRGENPFAEEHYLKGMKFESAAIRVGQASPGQPAYYFVACDYEGPEQFAFLRMSKRFPTRPRGTGDNWIEGNFCRGTSVADCPFTVFEPVP